MTRYASKTINATNPFARFAHRTRVKLSLALAQELIDERGSLLDYGCGDGHFIAELGRRSHARVLGYEPYPRDFVAGDLLVVNSLDKVEGRLDVITIFEVVEHLTDAELDAFLSFASSRLSPGGKVLVSMPIEVGPALLLKEARRAVARGGRLEYTLRDLFRAAFLAVPGPRATNLRGSHRGFDFRRATRRIEQRGFQRVRERFSPFERLGFYGNSQVFLVFEKSSATRSSASGVVQ